MSILEAIISARRIVITGQRVTFEKDATGWVATGWERGLPVARRPVSYAYLSDILARFDPSLITVTV